MRLILIAGSRCSNQDDNNRCAGIVGSAFKLFNKSTDIIVSGGAGSGADFWAKKFSRIKRFRYIEAPAFWQNESNKFELNGLVKTDKSAGPFRNETMAMVADIALIVWDGKSTGTLNMINNLEKHKKPYWVVQL